jgi:molybdate transport system substrate-binding protein
MLSAGLVSACEPPGTSPAVQVAAASDLAVAFAELGKTFEQRTGVRVSFSFAASGTLASQLSQGAPFDVFAAASPAFVERAVRAGACDATTIAAYAQGHLVVWSKRRELHLHRLADLQQATIEHVAIANPDTAPYGKAAREALSNAGLLPAMESKLVYAENVRQALQLAQTGNADVAIVALSLVASDQTGTQLSVEPTLHRPIEQTLVVCNNGKNQRGGRAFAALVASGEGQAVLERHGLSRARDELAK